MSYCHSPKMTDTPVMFRILLLVEVLTLFSSVMASPWIPFVFKSPRGNEFPQDLWDFGDVPLNNNLLRYRYFPIGQAPLVGQQLLSEDLRSKDGFLGGHSTIGANQQDGTLSNFYDRFQRGTKPTKETWDGRNGLATVRYDSGKQLARGSLWQPTARKDGFGDAFEFHLLPQEGKDGIKWEHVSGNHASMLFGQEDLRHVSSFLGGERQKHVQRPFPQVFPYHTPNWHLYTKWQMPKPLNTAPVLGNFIKDTKEQPLGGWRFSRIPMFTGQILNIENNKGDMSGHPFKGQIYALAENLANSDEPERTNLHSLPKKDDLISKDTNSLVLEEKLVKLNDEMDALFNPFEDLERWKGRRRSVEEINLRNGEGNFHHQVNDLNVLDTIQSSSRFPQEHGSGVSEHVSPLRSVENEPIVDSTEKIHKSIFNTANKEIDEIVKADDSAHVRQGQGENERISETSEGKDEATDGNRQTATNGYKIHPSKADASLPSRNEIQPEITHESGKDVFKKVPKKVTLHLNGNIELTVKNSKEKFPDSGKQHGIGLRHESSPETVSKPSK